MHLLVLVKRSVSSWFIWFPAGGHGPNLPLTVWTLHWVNYVFIKSGLFCVIAWVICSDICLKIILSDPQNMVLSMRLCKSSSGAHSTKIKQDSDTERWNISIIWWLFLILFFLANFNSNTGSLISSNKSHLASRKGGTSWWCHFDLGCTHKDWNFFNHRYSIKVPDRR